VLQQPGRPLMRGGGPGPDAADKALLGENPLLGELYAHDAVAALGLLKRVKAALQASNPKAPSVKAPGGKAPGGTGR
jgi:hypothetical protein